MKRILLNLEKVRDFIELSIIAKINKPKESDNSIKQLLHYGLRESYTFNDIAKVKEIFQEYKDEFTFEEFICFASEIRFQILIVQQMNQLFPNNGQLHTVAELAAMFKNASYTECDTIWLHVKKNAHHYTRKDGLRIYETLYCNRKAAIKYELQHG
jgi:hypothetical protein